MPKPVILCVDADPAALRLLEDELGSEVNGDYRLATAESASEARTLLKRWQRRGMELALVLADSELAEFDSLLADARAAYPEVRVALLCSAAQAGPTGAECDVRLARPTAEGSGDLLAPVTDLLDDWRASHAGGAAVRLVGHRWSRRTHAIRQFLACNLVPFRSLDVESSHAAQRIVRRADAKSSELPLVLLPDGTVLKRPEDKALAEAIGLQTEAAHKFYDLLIVGAGPAGLAAAVYGASEGLSCALLEQQAPGGQAGTSARIENYLGFPAGLSGAELTRRAVDQAHKFGAELVSPRAVKSIRADGDYRFAVLDDGTELACNALLLACGVEYRQLDVPGADQLTGAGIYYGAARAEAQHCARQRVLVVGGGNSAGQAAVYLAEHASSVALLIRGKQLADGMSQYLVERIEEAENIEFWTQANITAVHGGEHLEAVTVEDLDGGEERRVEAGALYLFIGAAPNTGWLADSGVQLDEDGYVLTGRSLRRRGDGRWALDREPLRLETSLPGVFAAGDVRSTSVKRVASAVGEGGMAIQMVHEYLGEL